MNDDLAEQAVRKLLMALQGLKRNPAAIGPIALRAWGVKAVIDVVRFLIPPGPEHRQAILGAARGEGCKQPAQPIVTNGPITTIHLSFSSAKLGPEEAPIVILEAGTPALAKVLSRATERGVFGMPVPVASVEDLILQAAAAGDQATMVELLRAGAARIDAPYVKKEAEAAGLFDKVKTAWAEAKK